MSGRVVYRHAAGDAVVVAAPGRRHRSIRAGWSAIARNPFGRACAWSSPSVPDLVVHHCGHPTALRPYWLELADGRQACRRKFRRLREAQAAAELLHREQLLGADEADELLAERFDDWASS